MRGRGCRAAGFVFAAAMALAAKSAEATDWQLRPFVGFTFAGDSTFAPNVGAPGKVHSTIGINSAWLGEIVGVDVDVARTPDFFQTGDASDLILTSSVTTLTGNVVLTAPRKWTEYVLRPYVVAGGGLMRLRATDTFQVFEVAQVRPAIDFGAGALGFITSRVGVLWEVRRFQTIGGDEKLSGFSFGAEKVSFWRATMAVAIRY